MNDYNPDGTDLVCPVCGYYADPEDIAETGMCDDCMWPDDWPEDSEDDI